MTASLAPPHRMAEIHAAAFSTSRPWSAAEFTSLLSSPLVFAITLQDGFALGRVVADEAELLTIAVMPTVQRAGTGRRLLDDYEVQAHARAAETSFLEVAEDNVAAVSLYRSVGYETRTMRQGYYSRGNGKLVNALIMFRKLSL